MVQTCTQSVRCPSDRIEALRIAAVVEPRRKPWLLRWRTAGLFLNADGEALERKRTRFADGFDSSVLGATVGADYRVASSLIFGIAGAYRNTTGDFEGGGEFDTQSVGGSLYMSFVPSAESFLDLSVGYANKSHEVSRRAQFSEIAISGTLRNDFDGLVDSDTDGSELGAHARFGYDFVLGRWTVGPRLGASWTHTEVDGYTETGGGRGTVAVGGIRGAAGLALIFEDQEADSLQGLAGAQASFTANPSFGALIVQFNADYIHEFDNEQRRVDVSFVQDLRPTRKVFQYQTEEPVEGFVKAGLNFVFVLQGGIQPFINLQAMVGNEQFKSNYAATLGVRFEL
jgi:outer membrane autotransporter protein